MDDTTKQILQDVETSLRAMEHMLYMLEEQGLDEHQDSYVKTVLTSLLAARKTIHELVTPIDTEQSDQEVAPKPSVLIADDDAVQRMWVSRTLEEAGFNIGWAANGPDAIRAANERQWDVILMDCEIPVIDGFEVTRLIKNSEECASRLTPIVAYSGYSIAGYKQRCLQVGMSAFLSKPASKEELVTCLKAAAAGTSNG